MWLLQILKQTCWRLQWVLSPARNDLSLHSRVLTYEMLLLWAGSQQKPPSLNPSSSRYLRPHPLHQCLRHSTPCKPRAQSQENSATRTLREHPEAHCLFASGSGWRMWVLRLTILHSSSLLLPVPSPIDSSEGLRSVDTIASFTCAIRDAHQESLNQRLELLSGVSSPWSWASHLGLGFHPASLHSHCKMWKHQRGSRDLSNIKFPSRVSTRTYIPASKPSLSFYTPQQL